MAHQQLRPDQQLGTAGLPNSFSQSFTVPANSAFPVISSLTLTNGASITIPSGSELFITGDQSKPVRSSADVAGGLTAFVSIPASIQFVSSGISLPGQIAAANSFWIVEALGAFSPANSATVRSWQAALYWGATQLPIASAVIPASSATAFGFVMRWHIFGTSSTAITTAGITSPTLVLSPASANLPTSTNVSAGAQILDLRFAVSTVVAGDGWLIYGVVIRRVK